jgi:translation initiation factor IF-2
VAFDVTFDKVNPMFGKGPPRGGGGGGGGKRAATPPPGGARAPPPGGARGTGGGGAAAAAALRASRAGERGSSPVSEGDNKEPAPEGGRPGADPNEAAAGMGFG